MTHPAKSSQEPVAHYHVCALRMYNATHPLRRNPIHSSKYRNPYSTTYSSKWPNKVITTIDMSS